MSDLFDSFYTKFILRDLFGKIIPGYILLICIIGTCLPKQNFFLLQSMSVGLWILSLGIAWLLGLAIQGIGILTRQFRRFPKIFEHYGWKEIIKKFPKLSDKDLKAKNIPKEDRSKMGLTNFQEIVVDFAKVATPYEMKIRERLVIIKEASGNGSLATGLMFIITLLNGFLYFTGCWELPEFLKSLKSNSGLFIFFLLILALIFFSLRFMHSHHIDMKFRFMISVLRRSRLYRSKLRD